MKIKSALEILNQVEPNGELLDTDKAIEAMELYAKQFSTIKLSCTNCGVSEVISKDNHCNCCGAEQKSFSK